MRVLCQKKKHRITRNPVPKGKKKDLVSGNEGHAGFVDLVKSVNRKNYSQNKLQNQKNGKNNIREISKSPSVPKSNTMKYYEDTFLKRQAYPNRLSISRNLEKFSLSRTSEAEKRKHQEKENSDDEDEEDEEEDEEEEQQQKKQSHITKMSKLMMDQLKERSMERESVQDIELNETEESEEEGKAENLKEEDEFDEFNYMENKTKKTENKKNEIENHNDVVDTHLFDLLDEEITEKESEQQEPKEIIQNTQEEEKPLIDLTYCGIKKNYNILRELKKKFNEIIHDEKNEIHNDILFLNMYALTHKKIYSIGDKKGKTKKYYSCNEILEMIINEQLTMNSSIKRKNDPHYYALKHKMGELYFLKQLEMYYYMGSKKNRYISRIEKEIEKEVRKENVSFFGLDDSILYDKISFLKQYFKSPYSKNLAEIKLIPLQKEIQDFDGNHKLITDLFVTKHISVYFYHVIEKKMNQFIAKRNAGPLYIKIKLKTDYPEALEAIFEYIFNDNFNLRNLEFPLLVTMYIECIRLKIHCVLNQIIQVISEKSNFENIVRILPLSLIFNEVPIFKDFIRILADSSHFLFLKKYHYNMNLDLFIYLLSLDNLMISEMKIFIESIHYITYNKCDINEQNFIFQNIRFSNLKEKYLLSIQKYLKKCFENILDNKPDHTNLICLEGKKGTKPNPIMLDKNLNKETKEENTETATQTERTKIEYDKIHNVFKWKYYKKDVANDTNTNQMETQKPQYRKNENNEMGLFEKDKQKYEQFFKDVKDINKFYRNINADTMESLTNIKCKKEKSKKDISCKKITTYFNNIYNILFDETFKKIFQEESKRRCAPWYENEYLQTIDDGVNQAYYFQLIRKETKKEWRSFTYGDSRFINECKWLFKITNSKMSNVCIGFVLNTNELKKPNDLKNTIPNKLIQNYKNLVIYLDFAVNDFFACTISDTYALINTTRLFVTSSTTFVETNDLVTYKISVIQDILTIHVEIVPKNITLMASFPILQPRVFIGDVLRKPFIDIKPFFILQNFNDSIAIPVIE